METEGIVASEVTVSSATTLQPLEGSVTVTSYIPGSETDLDAPVMPAPQLKVAPVVVDEAVSTSLCAVHVKTAGMLKLTLGVGARLIVTLAVAVALLASVTVTVYVTSPKAVITGFGTETEEMPTAGDHW